MNKIKELTLFIITSIVMQNGRIIDKDFEIQLNDFIYKYAEDNTELFNVIFDTDLLKKFIVQNYDILTLEQIKELINPYKSNYKYGKLIDEVGQTKNIKIIKLATMFNDYYNEIINLYNVDANRYYPKGYPKILQ